MPAAVLLQNTRSADVSARAPAKPFSRDFQDIFSRSRQSTPQEREAIEPTPREDFAPKEAIQPARRDEPADAKAAVTDSKAEAEEAKPSDELSPVQDEADAADPDAAHTDDTAEQSSDDVAPIVPVAPVPQAQTAKGPAEATNSEVPDEAIAIEGTAGEVDAEAKQGEATGLSALLGQRNGKSQQHKQTDAGPETKVAEASPSPEGETVPEPVAKDAKAGKEKATTQATEGVKADATANADAKHAPPTHHTANVEKPQLQPQAAAAPELPVRSEQVFRQDNVDNVVQQVRTKLLPGGGNMQIRLDPPTLGAVMVSVEVIDGSMTASFRAENPEAARLLGQNLSQLKSSLEQSGVIVDRLTVKQGPAESSSSQSSSDRGNDDSRQSADTRQGRSEEQRREQLRRMWAKAAGQDDLDLMA